MTPIATVSSARMLVVTTPYQVRTGLVPRLTDWRWPENVARLTLLLRSVASVDYIILAFRR